MSSYLLDTTLEPIKLLKQDEQARGGDSREAERYGERGLSTYLSNDSPVQGGGRETNWLVTLQRPEGLLFFVFTAPERDFETYENTFQQMLYSVRFAR